MLSYRDANQWQTLWSSDAPGAAVLIDKPNLLSYIFWAHHFGDFLEEYLTEACQQILTSVQQNGVPAPLVFLVICEVEDFQITQGSRERAADFQQNIAPFRFEVIDAELALCDQIEQELINNPTVAPFHDLLIMKASFGASG